jgi:hypothetical protein
MMNGRVYYLGRNRGWKLAARYANATKQERREIRARLAALKDSFSQFTRGLWDGFQDLAEQRSEAILAGLAPRTISPSKLTGLLDRINSS